MALSPLCSSRGPPILLPPASIAPPPRLPDLVSVFSCITHEEGTRLIHLKVTWMTATLVSVTLETLGIKQYEGAAPPQVCAGSIPGTHSRLALSSPLQSVGEQVEIASLPLREKGVPQLQHVPVHDAVLPHRVI